MELRLKEFEDRERKRLALQQGNVGGFWFGTRETGIFLPWSLLTLIGGWPIFVIALYHFFVVRRRR